MRVIGMMTARDEEDILEEALKAAASKYDVLLCADCGSEDSTPKILWQFSARHDNVYFLKSLPPLTPMLVKRHIWSSFRRNFSMHDWWCFADADEFVDSDMHETVNYANANRHDHILGEHVNFYYTQRDYQRWCDGTETMDSRAFPIRSRRKYYRFHTAQIRLFRNLPWFRWNKDSSIPSFLSAPCDRRVRFLHFQYRDMEQIQRRLRIRSGEYCRSDPADTHWLMSNVSDAISADDDPTLQYDDGSSFVPDPSLPKAQKQPSLKTFIKYSLNIARGVTTPRHEEKWFDGINIKN